MDPGKQKIEAIFGAAIELTTPGQREVYLAKVCRNDQALRSEVEALLQAYDKAGGFLTANSEHEDPAAQTGPAATAALPILPEKAGDRIGRYKLLQEIGEGGCGVVYMAEQEEPIRRRVALKVIKLGMDTKNVIARFEAERQALALMDHPNIAKVFDAGATERGRPYFVMELVRGVKITDYCDQNSLSTRQRLDLFIQVCHAIQHAHQKGIIHRDIKPSNILVTLNDGVPVPKVIDFGIAKATEQRLTDKTVFTAFEQFIGTPAYMSPEQAVMTSVDIDTRSDIYALGVLLYELLTGKTPFDSKTLVAAGMEEMRRIIREKEPTKPSTRLSRLEAKEQITTAQRRATEAPKLIRSLRGDLDWLVMKCLEKDRTRRYQTANELLRDVQCHLTHHPVSAAAPTLVYRATKCIRRHRRVFATAAAFAGLVMLGGALIVWQAWRAGQVRWALETALPEIERLLGKEEYTPAFNLAERSRPLVAGNPRFEALSARVVRLISVETTPPSAEVFLRDYNDANPKWEPIGRSPINEMKVSRGFKRWRIALAGYESAEGAFLTKPDSGTLDTFRGTNSDLTKPTELKVKLDKSGTIAPGMVRIQGPKFKFKASLKFLDTQSLPELNLADFLLDRYEVTNRRYKEFVEAGGYRRPEYWKHKFFTDDGKLSWQEAMKLFVDRSGQPGPATWEHGDFPQGKADHPVGGVSWYEAAAYAEFAGKQLPTVYHWSLAAGDLNYVDVGFVVPLSNFAGRGPAAVGTFQGMTSHGVYDLAGNVKEWCFNATLEGYRVNAGGGWNEAQYMFSEAEKYPPLFREANLGFRCMKPLTDDGVWEQAAGSVPYRALPVLGNRQPCPDEIFQAYRNLFDYHRLGLHSRIEAAEDLDSYTRREKVSFDAPYGNERMIAHLFLPRTGKRPFQTVVYFPGIGALSLHSIAGYGSTDVYENHTKNGRAFVFPILQGTFERMIPPDKQGKTTALEDGITWAKDFRRTLDYLETRPEDFDMSKLAYEGLSWGGIWGGIIPAIDTRIKLAVLIGGGLWLDLPSEYSQVNFAPRIKIPVLIQNGIYDYQFPVESNQRVYVGLFGTPLEDRYYKLYQTGHAVWAKHEVVKDELDFLDKYFGSAK